MHICELCGKEFPFPSKLLRHLSKKIPCYTIKPSGKNEDKVEKAKEIHKKVCQYEKILHQNEKKVCQEYKKVCNEVKKYQCAKCEKVLKSKLGLDRHNKICKGVHSLQCPTCFKVFSDKTAKYKHIKNVKCSPPEKQIDQCKIDLEEENRLLKKEILILKATSRGSHTTNNTTNNINNITNNYIIKYNPETRCITSNDPNAPVPELLCLNGFKHEAAKSKLKDIDRDALQKHIDNVRLSDNYYALYTFFFRNVDNQRLHMFNMGKSSNSTHAHVFNNGSLEKIHKSTLFESISKYIGQYLLNMSVDNLDVINKVLTDQKSKDAFIEVMRDKSHTFNYYRENDDVMELEE